MRSLLAVLAIFAASATHASTVTWHFTGTATNVYSSDPQTCTPDGCTAIVIADDPNEAAYWEGQQLFNGDASLVGSITFDPDIKFRGGADGPFPNMEALTWQISVEGITFYRDASNMYGPESFEYSDDLLYAHAEYNGLHDTSILWFVYQTLQFNFDNGQFIGGTFSFDGYGPANGSTGVWGVIDSVRVPEPTSLSLFLMGLFVVASMRRKLAPE